MAHNRPLTTDEKLEIVEVLKRGNLSHRAIAQQFKRSQSTISAIARDAGITPTHRRRRTLAAKDVEGTYSREERVAIADRALSVLNDLLSSGGLNPRELKEVTASLKQTLDARRAEDFPEAEENKRSKNDEEDPIVEVEGGLRMRRSGVEQVDKDLEQQKERMLNLEPAAFPSYGVDPETSPPWMVEAYHKMLAKKRGEDVDRYQGEGLA